MRLILKLAQFCQLKTAKGLLTCAFMSRGLTSEVHNGLGREGC